MSTQKKDDKTKKPVLVKMDDIFTPPKKKNSQKKSKANQTDFNKNELKEMIGKKAYELFLERGSQHGDDWQDWFQAEQELKARLH